IGAERDDGNRNKEAEHHQEAQLGVFGPPHLAVGHGVHQGHIAVYADQSEDVDAAVCVHLDAQVDGFAQEEPERPVEAVPYVDSPERQTGQQQQVGGRQVAQVDLGHGAGLLVQAENHQDKDV
uniref:Uncharacterized protein n=1 Tax=Takifugu rubripes TaxID=31033 RepID=A0A3B5KKD1_TAKRU